MINLGLLCIARTALSRDLAVFVHGHLLVKAASKMMKKGSFKMFWQQFGLKVHRRKRLCMAEESESSQWQRQELHSRMVGQTEFALKTN